MIEAEKAGEIWGGGTKNWEDWIINLPRLVLWECLSLKIFQICNWYLYCRSRPVIYYKWRHKCWHKIFTEEFDIYIKLYLFLSLSSFNFYKILELLIHGATCIPEFSTHWHRHVVLSRRPEARSRHPQASRKPSGSSSYSYPCNTPTGDSLLNSPLSQGTAP